MFASGCVCIRSTHNSTTGYSERGSFVGGLVEGGVKGRGVGLMIMLELLGIVPDLQLFARCAPLQRQAMQLSKS